LLGNDDNSPTKKASGSNMPVEIWSQYMTAAHAGIDPVDLPSGTGRSDAVSLQDVAKPIVKPLDALIGILNGPAAAPETTGQVSQPSPRPRRSPDRPLREQADAAPAAPSPPRALSGATAQVSPPAPQALQTHRPVRAGVARETQDLLPPEDIPNVGAIPESDPSPRHAAPARDRNLFDNLFGGG